MLVKVRVPDLKLMGLQKLSVFAPPAVFELEQGPLLLCFNKVKSVSCAVPCLLCLGVVHKEVCEVDEVGIVDSELPIMIGWIPFYLLVLVEIVPLHQQDPFFRKLRF